MTPVVAALVKVLTPVVLQLIEEAIDQHEQGKSRRAIAIHFKRRAAEAAHDAIVRGLRG